MTESFLTVLETPFQGFGVSSLTESEILLLSLSISLTTTLISSPTFCVISSIPVIFLDQDISVLY